jgi:excisionase family DNA binding protein
MVTKDQTEELVLSVTAASKALGISRSTAFQLVNSGRLPAIRISDRRWIIPKAALLKMLESAEPKQTQ